MQTKSTHFTEICSIVLDVKYTADTQTPMLSHYVFILWILNTKL